ncbi:hypothetical protein, partial [Serratia marcescens]|uniref:hypothetical protein n=1 Tax=Serratia marcescens TaxID=615 RepID=UPI001E4E1D61
EKRCSKIYCMNFTSVSHSSRLDIFFASEDAGYRLVECPHRLSDKLLKSSAEKLIGAGCVYYAFSPESQAFISLSSR